MKHVIKVILVFCILTGLNSYSLFGQAADFAIKNASIYTSNDNQPFANALAVIDDSIVYVGDSTGLIQFIGINTEVIDANERTVIPGIHDVHMHPLEAGSPVGASCILDNTETDPENYAIELQACNPQPNANGWILGWGYSIYTLLDATRSTKLILDDIYPNTPVAIMEETSHSVWVNSAALQLLGITSSTIDPEGGHIVRVGGTNEPDGLLLDNAGNEVFHQALQNIPSIRQANYDGLVNYSLPLLAKNGITSICEGRTYWKRDYHNIWRDIYADSLLTARVVLGLWAYPEDVDSVLIDTLSAMYDAGDDMLKINQIKVYSDGITSNATAALHDLYHDNLGWPFNKGLNYFDSSRLRNLIVQLEPIGFDFHIHAIGDRGIHESLNAIESSNLINGNIGARHRITHVEILDSFDLPRFNQLNVTADVQVAGDFTQPHNWSENDVLIGSLRSSNLVPIKSLFNNSARITLSSDWDVSTLNPFVGMQNALTRSPQELSSLEDVIKSYTIHPAYVMRQENTTGSLEVGKFADLLILDRDIFSIPNTQINQTKVLLTMLSGEIIYRDSLFPLDVSEVTNYPIRIKINQNLRGDDVCSIEINAIDSGEMNLVIRDLSGKTFVEQKVMYGSGLNRVEIRLDRFSEGVYIITFDEIVSSFQKSMKFVVVR